MTERNKIKYVNHISVDDYNMLRKSVGWKVLEYNQALTGLKNTSFLVSAVVDNKTVGMARVISDGGYFALIVDVIVLPEYQQQGIGKTMMEMIMNSIRGNLKAGEAVFVNLMAAKGKEAFYNQFGFIIRPNEEVGAGMTQYIEHQGI